MAQELFDGGAATVSVSADEELSVLFPRVQAAIVTVRTKDGDYTERVDYPKGEPENPLTDVEFRDRYGDLMDYACVDKSVSAMIFDAVYRENAKVEELIKDI